MTEDSFDVAIVGGGIAGAGLGTVLARAGLGVVVLERQATYKDRVRGEWMAPWGVAEAQRTGLYEVLREAGGHHLTRHVTYGDWVPAEEAEQSAVALGGMLPGVAGPLCLPHVTATQALLDAAEAAGCTVVRSVTNVEPTFGDEPRLAWESGGNEQVIRCRLVVGADGRVSTVRDRADIGLERVEPRNYLAGLLVDGLDFWPEDTQTVGAAAEVMFLVFPQGRGRARLYLGISSEHRSSLAGTDGATRFLESFRVGCLPFGERFTEARIAGPCASYAGDDTWCDEPFGAGVLLIGDAAGYSDPTIGQGLSIAMRDVRVVSEILLAGNDWAPESFAPYAKERAERMRRLRTVAKLMGIVHTTFGPEGPDMRKRVFPKLTSDPLLFMLLATQFAGPEVAPPEAFASDVVENALAG